MNKSFSLSAAAILSLACMSSNFAATAIDLGEQPASILKKFMQSPSITNQTSPYSLERLSSQTDFNQTTHTRVQQKYNGYPVWGADAVIHTPHGGSSSLSAIASSRKTDDVTMNGTLYDAIPQDLSGSTSNYIFSDATAKKVFDYAVQTFSAQTNLGFEISDHHSRLIVYVDKEQKAHWAYLVSFFARPQHGMPAVPTFIIDAVTQTIYQQWNDLKTLKNVDGGGVGGNEGPIGKLSYDGLPEHFPKLTFQRNDKKGVCYLRNDLTIVKDRSNKDAIPSFKCEKPDSGHNNVYWNTRNDANNGGYSPVDDAIYSDTIVRDLYKKWFNVDMLSENGKPMQVTMIVHDPEEGQNAYYENGKMVFGDGDDESYPVVAPSVVAHEMSHGFTDQHSGLVYSSQSGGLNESFSDMADKAVEFKVYGKNNWQIDPELLKEGGRLLRWMDDPTQDCGGKKPGDKCSIAHMKDYYEGLNVHFSSGVFNKAFYLLSNSSGWDTKKAFEVMTQANMHYWTATTSFSQAACGVIKATKDYKYDVENVINAMKEVGVDTSKCK
jgi:pseudolysin